MLNKKSSRLSREIAVLTIASVLTAIFAFFFIDIVGRSIAENYIVSKYAQYDGQYDYYLNIWIGGLSITAALIIFVVLYMFLLGQKFQYLKTIIEGVGALQTHQMKYKMPVEGDNEFTDLALAINYLAETETQLREKEKQINDERKMFIKSLSHDIRTPLTSIISYSQMVENRENLSDEEVRAFASLVHKKSIKIKEMTNKLIEDAYEEKVEIESVKLLMQQLVEEWSFEIEDDFQCEIEWRDCPDFSGKIHIGEMQRIFDNLVSNIKKYADPEKSIAMRLYEEDGYMVIEQSNRVKKSNDSVESFGIGLDSIKRIAENYGGRTEVYSDDSLFKIKIYISLEFFRNS